MNKIKTISIYCGASAGHHPIYKEAAQKMAQQLLAHNLALVYGGGSVGLMGELADYMMANGGEVIGVMPRFLVEKEIAHTEISELHVVETMSERKQKLAELSDAFILLPGGIGSLDEFFDMLTGAQLGLHNKPRGILNTAHYYDDLIFFLNDAVLKGFWNQANQSRLMIESEAEKLVPALLNYRGSLVNRWENAENLEETPQ